MTDYYCIVIDRYGAQINCVFTIAIVCYFCYFYHINCKTLSSLHTHQLMVWSLQFKQDFKTTTQAMSFAEKSLKGMLPC